MCCFIYLYFHSVVEKSVSHKKSFSSGKITGKENALVICNHRSDIDWLIGWVLAQVPIFPKSLE